jgi:hypothetical protein
MVIIFGRIRINIRANFSKAIGKGVDNGKAKTVNCFRVNTKAIKETAMEFTIGLMEMFIKGNLKTIIATELGRWTGLMVRLIWGIGKMDFSMEKAK